MKTSEKFVISGGKKLEGEIEVRGAKNAALKIFPAALLTDEAVRVTNVPELEDCARAKEMLEALGKKVVKSKSGVYEVRGQSDAATALPEHLVNKFRASIMFVGPLLARYGEARFPHPGGCVIGAGTRPIDLFLSAFRKMGASVEVQDDYYHIKAKKLKGTAIFFSKVTVTGTESIMMTASLARGETVLKNCAMEPEIVALADHLNKSGARIEGAGTPTIRISGVKKLMGGEYNVMPDRIEAGTFAMLAAASKKGEVLIKNCRPEHLEALWSLFDSIGVNYVLYKDSILIKPSKKLKACDVMTHEYPGFATDLQPPYTVLMTQAAGSSLIHETIYDRRLLFTDLLSQMGANVIMADPHRVIVRGPTRLRGRKLISPDLRAGIALVMAGLVAEGVTEINNVYQIDRGYEKIEARLKKIGADIKRIN